MLMRMGARCKQMQTKKIKDEARKTAKPKTNAGKSSTGPDFALDNGSVRLCACASKILLETVLVPSVGLMSESAAGPDLFGATKETTQVAVPTPSDVATMVSVLTLNFDADQVLFGGCSTASAASSDLFYTAKETPSSDGADSYQCGNDGVCANP